MTRRSLFKTLLGCVAAPFVALAARQKSIKTITVDARGVGDAKAVAEAAERGIRRALQSTLDSGHVRYKTENGNVLVKVRDEDWKPLFRDLRA